MKDNILTLPGAPVPGNTEPDKEVVEGLEKALAHARSGQLRFFAAIGFTGDGLRLEAILGDHDNTCETLGALELLKDHVKAGRPAPRKVQE